MAGELRNGSGIQSTIVTAPFGSVAVHVVKLLMHKIEEHLPVQPQRKHNIERSNGWTGWKSAAGRTE